MAGTDSQRRILLGCNSCHTLQRIVRSSQEAAEFLQVCKRMAGYYPGSTPLHPQRLVGDIERNLTAADLCHAPDTSRPAARTRDRFALRSMRISAMSRVPGEPAKPLATF